ncbi:hypothetical protein Plhal703r1_c59g0164791 [Plasmopara halstedii]
MLHHCSHLRCEMELHQSSMYYPPASSMPGQQAHLILIPDCFVCSHVCSASWCVHTISTGSDDRYPLKSAVSLSRYDNNLTAIGIWKQKSSIHTERTLMPRPLATPP